jgi:hypothetical protein
VADPTVTGHQFRAVLRCTNFPLVADTGGIESLGLIEGPKPTNPCKALISHKKYKIRDGWHAA